MAWFFEPHLAPVWLLYVVLAAGFFWGRQIVRMDRERLVLRRLRFKIVPVHTTVYSIDCFEELGIRRHRHRTDRGETVRYLLEALGKADVLVGVFEELEPARERARELSALSGLPARERVDETLEVETRGPLTT